METDSREALAKAKVLLVEDDPAQADATKKILQRTGYDVLWSKDGIDAIKVVKTMKPDVILLDVVLPGLDGYDVCRWLKRDEDTKGIPVIMLTGNRELADKISGLQIGADNYLTKPYDTLELNAHIYASLRAKSLQDELQKKNKQLENLLERIEYRAMTDALTGLYNRRRFHEVLEKEIDRSKRYGTPCSLIMVDIDNFKKVNDDYGHEAGDAVLKEVSTIIMKSVRGVDTSSRFGGEEFMVILPNTQRENGKIGAERMRARIERHLFPEIERPITVSIGIAGIPDARIKDQDRLIRCADCALYRAKRNGRNRIETADGKDLATTC